MSFHLELEKTGEVAVLKCAGRIVRGKSLYRLRNAVTSLSPLRVVVLDLSEVELLDGGGLGMLVFLHNWASFKGIRLNVVNPSHRIREMLQLTGLADVFHISSVNDIIEMFCGGVQTSERADQAAA